jgi:hypothetical protein
LSTETKTDLHAPGIDRASCGGSPKSIVDGVDLAINPPPPSEFRKLKRSDVNIIAPPMPALLTARGNGSIVASKYAPRRSRRPRQLRVDFEAGAGPNPDVLRPACRRFNEPKNSNRPVPCL